jgi:hypothetical protein
MVAMRSFMLFSIEIRWWEAFELLDKPRNTSIAI